MTQTEILNRLKEGNMRFVSDKLDGKLQNSARRMKLTSGQDPYAIILSCADSRVVPELAFDAGLGELFVIRVAGNVANVSSIASIEYAVANIKSPVIIVLGHQSCGAVTAAVSGGDNGDNLNHLLGHIAPAVAESPKDASITHVVKENARLTAIEMKEKSAIINDAVTSGKLVIKTAYYNLDTGVVDFLD